MPEYEPQERLSRDDMCECGHYTFNHATSIKAIFGKPHAHCEDCTCPKYHYKQSRIRKFVGGEYVEEYFKVIE